MIGARRHCWLIDVKVEAIQLELRVLRVITSHAGSHTHEVDQVDGLRDEIDDRDEPVDVDVLVGEPTAHDVARVGGKLHPGASEVTVQGAGIHQQRIPAVQMTVIEQQSGQDGRIGGVVLVQGNGSAGEHTQLSLVIHMVDGG